LKGLAKIIGLELPPASPDLPTLQKMLQEALARLLPPSPTACTHSQQLTHLLVNLEIAISQLRDEDSETDPEP
jgi:hypothetical protein